MEYKFRKEIKMSIEIQLRYRKPRDEKRQRAFISVSGVNAETYDFEVGNVPIELDTDGLVQTYLETRRDEFHLFCLKKTWKGADIKRFQVEGKSELKAFLDWIDDGHKNIIGYEDEEEEIPIYEVISNHPYHGTHPPQFDWIESFSNENAPGLEQIREAIIQMLRDQI